MVGHSTLTLKITERQNKRRILGRAICGGFSAGAKVELSWSKLELRVKLTYAN